MRLFCSKPYDDSLPHSEHHQCPSRPCVPCSHLYCPSPCSLCSRHSGLPAVPQTCQICYRFCTGFSLARKALHPDLCKVDAFTSFKSLLKHTWLKKTILIILFKTTCHFPLFSLQIILILLYFFLWHLSTSNKLYYVLLYFVYFVDSRRAENFFSNCVADIAPVPNQYRVGAQ